LYGLLRPGCPPVACPRRGGDAVAVVVAGRDDAMRAKGLESQIIGAVSQDVALMFHYHRVSFADRLVSIDCNKKFDFSDLVAPEFRAANDL
jgi:hypothetical protein